MRRTCQNLSLNERASLNCSRRHSKCFKLFRDFTSVAFPCRLTSSSPMAGNGWASWRMSLTVSAGIRWTSPHPCLGFNAGSRQLPEVYTVIHAQSQNCDTLSKCDTRRHSTREKNCMNVGKVDASDRKKMSTCVPI